MVYVQEVREEVRVKLHVDARSTSLLYAVPAEVRMEVKAKRMKKRRKKIGISVLLSATPLVAIVFVPIASAQGNPVNSRDLALHYQNTNWSTVQLLATSGVHPVSISI